MYHVVPASVRLHMPKHTSLLHVLPVPLQILSARVYAYTIPRADTEAAYTYLYMRTLQAGQLTLDFAAAAA